MEHRSGWRLAQFVAERSMPVFAQGTDLVPGAARWLSLCLCGTSAMGPHPLLSFPQDWGGIADGGLLEGCEGFVRLI